MSQTFASTGVLELPERGSREVMLVSLLGGLGSVVSVLKLRRKVCWRNGSEEEFFVGSS
jgi:hypothetical protein